MRTHGSVLANAVAQVQVLPACLPACLLLCFGFLVFVNNQQILLLVTVVRVQMSLDTVVTSLKTQNTVLAELTESTQSIEHPYSEARAVKRLQTAARAVADEGRCR